MPSDYLTLGRGEVLFAPFLAGTKTPGPYRFLGNCPDFSLSVSVETLEHMDSTRGLKEEDLSVITTRTVGGSITTDDMKPSNQALFFLGSASVLTTTAQTALSYVIAAASRGDHFQIGQTTANPTGSRALASVVVKNTATPATVYVLGTDYTIDTARGILTITDDSAINAAIGITVTYNTVASTRNQIVSGRNEIEGAILFKSANTVGKDVDYRLPWVKIRPEGDLAMIGDDFRSMNLTVKGLALPNTAIVYADDQVVI